MILACDSGRSFSNARGKVGHGPPPEAKLGEAVGLINNIAAVRSVLEKAGIEFTNGDEPGVRLRKTPRVDPAASIPVENLTSENDE
jgi:hypothetical protein